MKYVFRNNTVEAFFGAGWQFSGYDDITEVPGDAELCVWWYDAPIKFDRGVIADEIASYLPKLAYVLQQLPEAKTIVAFTMELRYDVPFCDSDCGAALAVSDYNRGLYELAAEHKNLKVIDLGEFTRAYRPDELIDWRFYFISQAALNPRLAKPFKKWFERKLDSIALKRKKCLVLDLDNTLWGGVLGEDGIDGIKIVGDYPGKAFRYFQEALLSLSRSGVILTICSKNNEADVWEAFEKNPGIVLKRDDFAAWRINWNDKAGNIRELAEDLNIGLDSFVFVDDNPTERELIKQLLPQVAVPDFPEQPYMLPEFFRALVNDYFKVYELTGEDRKKTEQYRANAGRAAARKTFADLDSFLQSLDMRLKIQAADEHNIARLAQLTQKTNQFNLTTRRYTDADIKERLAAGWYIRCLSVADRFGDNGITGLIMITPAGEIDNLLLSCRILGKGIETAFLSAVMNDFIDKGADRLCAEYLPTAKNSQVADFYERHGFALISEDSGVKKYEIKLPAEHLTIKPFYKFE